MNEQGVSVTICCHNSVNRLPETINHLKLQQVPENVPWEVLLIDNASTDDTAKFAQDLWGEFTGAPLRVIPEPKLGLINARMRGFREAGLDFVSFIDDDNWVAPNWVETVYNIMISHPEVGACGGRSEAVFEVEPPRWFEKFQKWYAVGDQTTDQGDITWKRGVLWGAGLTIRKSAWIFLQENGFQPVLSGRKGSRLTSGEDIELCLAFRLAGWLLWYERGLYLKHFITKERMNWKYLRKLLRGIGASTISINPYKLALKADQAIPGDLGKKWLWLFRTEINNVCKLWKKLLLSRFKLCEGDEEVLKIEVILGSLEKIIELRSAYDKYIIDIRKAKWNLIGSQAKI